jgi:HTH-type transcriptional regulator/antitoxin HipB
MSSFQTYPVQAPSQLSVHIKSLRKARGLTQAALGERVGVKQARMADIEKNPGTVSLEQLMQVLHALDARVLLADTASTLRHRLLHPLWPTARLRTGKARSWQPMILRVDERPARWRLVLVPHGHTRFPL